jgi:hypothetical protein
VTKELAVASRQRSISHFLFLRGIFDKKEHDFRSIPTQLSYVSPIEDEIERPLC